jgi:hypothetical protein
MVRRDERSAARNLEAAETAVIAGPSCLTGINRDKSNLYRLLELLAVVAKILKATMLERNAPVTHNNLA